MTDHWELLDVLKAVLAVVAGVILGLEREMKDKAAGLKTITVISLGSALFAIISYKIGGPEGESTRIASYIVSGVGFLGAGVIFKDGVNVSGLTTAGIIWLAAAVGVSIGFGEFYLAATFMLASLIIVYSSPWINKVFYSKRQTRNLIFTIEKKDADRIPVIIQTIMQMDIIVEQRKIELKEGRITITAEAVVRNTNIRKLENFLLQHPDILHFSV